MSGDRGPDARFRPWLASRAPDEPPAGLLPDAMRRIDVTQQQRTWLSAWSVRPAHVAAAVAAVVVIAAGVGYAVFDRLPAGGPSASLPASNASEAAPSGSPRAVAIDPLAVARIALPHAGAQTVFEDEVAVGEDRIWIVAFDADSGNHLVGIDVTTNAVVADTPIDPAKISAGDAGVWMVSPWFVAPDPETFELTEVEETAGEPRSRGRHPSVTDVAVGLGHVWLLHDDGVSKVDPASGDVVAASDDGGVKLSIGCGAVWIWSTPAQPSDTTSQMIMSRIDPDTGLRHESFAIPETAQSMLETNGRCWLLDGNHLHEVVPGSGIVVTVEVPPTGTLQIAGESLWNVRAANVIQRVDPATGSGVGPMWQLPASDLHAGPKGTPDWRLLSAGGALWVLGADWLVRYDIPIADTGLPSTPESTPLPTFSPSSPVIPPDPSNPIIGGEPITDRDVDNSFTFVFRAAQGRYRAGQAIHASATLTLSGREGQVVARGSGTGIVVFGLESADGSVTIGPAGTSDCVARRLVAEEPLVVPFVKSGGYGYDDPLAPFYQAYLADEDLRLPAGTWTLRATAWFSTGADCGESVHRLEASVTVLVEP